MRGGEGDPRTVRVRLEGGHVTVTRGAEHRRVWRDVLAFQVDAKGGRQVVAVGDARDDLARGASAEELRALEAIRFQTALSPEGFDPEIARGFLAYVVHIAQKELPIWRRLRKPRFEVEIPGYDAIPAHVQLAFEDQLRRWGHPTLVNGSPARPLSRRLERASGAVLALLGLTFVAVRAVSGKAWVAAVSAAAIAIAWSVVESRWRARLLAGPPPVRRRGR